MHSLPAARQFVQRVDIGFGRGDHDIEVGAVPSHHPAVALQPHADVALRIGAAGNAADRVQLQPAARLYDRLDGGKGRVHGAVAAAAARALLAVGFDDHAGGRRLPRARPGCDVFERIEFIVGQGIAGGHQRLQVIVEYFMLAVGQVLELGKGPIQFGLRAKLKAERFQPRLERIAARVLAQHHFVCAPADLFGAHHLIGFPRLDHTVLVDAGLVRKRIGADNRLVRLHRESGNGRHQPADRHQLGGVDIDRQSN